MNTYYYHLKFSESEGLFETAIQGEVIQGFEPYIQFEDGHEFEPNMLNFAMGNAGVYQYMTEEPDFEARKAAFVSALEARYNKLNEEAKKFLAVSKLVKRATV